MAARTKDRRRRSSTRPPTQPLKRRPAPVVKRPSSAAGMKEAGKRTVRKR
jgi:hypothetical protein